MQMGNTKSLTLGGTVRLVHRRNVAVTCVVPVGLGGDGLSIRRAGGDSRSSDGSR